MSADHDHISDETWDRLLDAALEAKANAYVPYSSFPVGAAMLMDDGEIYRGANVENASLGATTCAERSAIQNAVTHGARRIRALAVVTDLERPAAPCGICRQVLSEFADHLPVLLASPTGEREFTSLDELLPHRFGPSDLDR